MMKEQKKVTKSINEIESGELITPSPLEGEGWGEGFKKRAAFTLAEVLITLGIIGVVAAVTIPNLVKDYQKKVYTTQLRKSVTTLQNAFKQIFNDDGVVNFSDTELGKACERNNTEDECISIVQKYFKVSKVVRSNDSIFQNQVFYGTPNNAGSKSFKFQRLSSLFILADGTQIFFPLGETQVYVDLNTSYNKPNILGRDLFVFLIAPNGVITPTCNHPETGCTPSGYQNKIDVTVNNYNNWIANCTNDDCRTRQTQNRDNAVSVFTDEMNGLNNKDVQLQLCLNYGFTCSRYLMLNDWKMDY